MYMPTFKRRKIIGAKRTKNKTRYKGRGQGRIKKDGDGEMKCNPGVVGKQKIANGSCITLEIKEKLKEVVPNEAEIIRDCDADDKCIVDSIPKSAKSFVEKHAFAPKQPSTWKKNKNTWLSNFDISDVMKQYQDADKYSDFFFHDPTYRDFDTMVGANSCVSNEICQFSLDKHVANGKRKFGFVFNLANHTQPGSHWIALYVDIDAEFAFFFNSTGERIPNEVNALVKRIQKQASAIVKPGTHPPRHYKIKLHTNYNYDHQEGNTECGMYALFFIITMLTNKHDDIEFKSHREKTNFFKKYKIEDGFVEKLRSEYFNR
jgi:hypothetical protein